MEQQRAFAVGYDKISRKLISSVKIEYGGQAIEVDALWDTGATNSCISHDVVSLLHPVITGMTRVNTPSGSRVMNTYCVNILLPNHVHVSDCLVIESEVGNQGIGLLVGMDIITMGDFAVSNFQGKTVFTFRYPSQQQINFAKAAAISDKIGPLHGSGKRKRR